MKLLPDWLQAGYRRLITPAADYLVRHQVNPNTITLVGTLFWVLGGILYGAGNIRLAGWLLGLTALFDVLDGQVARASGRSTKFGAFFDSTLDRVADGAVLGGLAYFFATSPLHTNRAMVVICIAGLVGSLLTSYTRARAEGLGLDARTGVLQRPERVVLLTVPQAFFGLALHGAVLIAIIILLAISAWLTVLQRIFVVYYATHPNAMDGHRPAEPATSPHATRVDVRSPALKGD